jgi:hypothetical protein
MRKTHFNLGYLISAMHMLLFNLTVDASAQQSPLVGPTYFSYKSACNLSLKFLKNKAAVLTIDGKPKICTIRQNPTAKDYFDLSAQGRLVAIFLYSEGEVVILNQQYQFKCEDAKGITLSLIGKDLDQQVLKGFQEYSNDADYIWAKIAELNDKAYYLQGYGCYNASAFILEKIVIKDPQRVVAWLNLGDSYWALNKQAAAREAYQQYSALMKSEGKNLHKIPQRVNERIK